MFRDAISLFNLMLRWLEQSEYMPVEHKLQIVYSIMTFYYAIRKTKLTINNNIYIVRWKNKHLNNEMYCDYTDTGSHELSKRTCSRNWTVCYWSLSPMYILCVLEVFVCKASTSSPTTACAYGVVQLYGAWHNTETMRGWGRSPHSCFATMAVSCSAATQCLCS